MYRVGCYLNSADAVSGMSVANISSECRADGELRVIEDQTGCTWLSRRPLGRVATARNLVMRRTAGAIFDLRSGREVQRRRCLGREGDRQPADSDRTPKSLAERNCRAILGVL